MAAGVKILGTKTLPCEITQLSKYEFKIILTQGLNRQIRRMCEALGYQVYTLKRTRIMNIELNNLPVGQWRDLTKKEKKTSIFRLKLRTTRLVKLRRGNQNLFLVFY